MRITYFFRDEYEPKDRYQCYRNNGYSRFYIIECVAIEIVKLIFS